MKKLLFTLIIASVLPMLGMDTSDDLSTKSAKRKLDSDEPEVSRPKREKLDTETQVDTKKREEARERVFNAIRVGDLTELQAALTYKPDIETPYTFHGKNEDVGTALQYALYEPSLPIIQTLIEHGANPNADTEHNWPPLVQAIDRISGPTQLHCVQALLMAKADPNLMDMDKYSGYTKMTPLHRVVFNDDLEENAHPICKMLLEHGADVNSRTLESETPIMVLCENLQDKIHDKTSSEDTLTFIMKYEPLSLAKLFLDAGADITIKDDAGNTPISILLPQSTLKHDCKKCIIDQTKSIRAIHKTMLEFLQKYVMQQKEDLQTILRECNKKNWPRPLTQIIADYLFGDTAPQATSPSDSNTCAASASSGSVSSTALAMPVDTTLNLDQ